MLTLLLGGVRSGKSAAAERRAAASAGQDQVTYIATAIMGHDEDLRSRVAAHQARRPPTWTTVEASGASLYQALETPSVVLLDSLGTWLSAHHDFVVDADALLAALAARSAHTVVVSDEVGLGVHAATAVGRRFADALGLLNQAVAAQASSVVLVVAGRELEL